MFGYFDTSKSETMLLLLYILHFQITPICVNHSAAAPQHTKQAKRIHSSLQPAAHTKTF